MPADRLESLVAEEASRADAAAVEDVVVTRELCEVNHPLLDEFHAALLEQSVQRRHADAGVEGERGEGLPDPGGRRRQGVTKIE